MKSSILPLLAAALAMSSGAQAAGDKPGPPSVVTIETRDYTVEFSGDRAWTISRILHKGQVITDRTGFYGTVFSPEGGKWIGTGHNEGGLEKVETATLTVDGKTVELKDKAVYHGQRAEVHKHSMIGPLKLEAAYIITDDAILEQHRYEVTEAVKIGTLYGFMHPFLPGTTEWMAEKPDGAIIDGKFDSQGGHQVKDDVKWTAIHDPNTHKAALVWYPTPLVGQGLKTFYWDKTVYHKLYNQLYSHADVAKGTKFTASVILQCFDTATDGWKEKAKALAKETQQRHDSGALKFQ